MFGTCVITTNVHRIATSVTDTMETLVNGRWWEVVEYKEVPSGLRVFFEDKTTIVVPHGEVHRRIKVKPPTW